MNAMRHSIWLDSVNSIPVGKKEEGNGVERHRIGFFAGPVQRFEKFNVWANFFS